MKRSRCCWTASGEGSSILGSGIGFPMTMCNRTLQLRSFSQSQIVCTGQEQKQIGWRSHLKGSGVPMYPYTIIGQNRIVLTNLSTSHCGTRGGPSLMKRYTSFCPKQYTGTSGTPSQANALEEDSQGLKSTALLETQQQHMSDDSSLASGLAVLSWPLLLEISVLKRRNFSADLVPSQRMQPWHRETVPGKDGGASPCCRAMRTNPLRLFRKTTSRL